MRNRLHVQGTVFKYPYLWAHQRNEDIDNPKARTACLIFRLEKPSGEAVLAIVPISDLPDSADHACLEVPRDEMKRAGLSEFRRAYLHLNEYNVDRESSSPSYNPRTPPIGKFSKQFIVRVGKLLAESIRAGRATRIDRG
jgi:hypothetical protein